MTAPLRVATPARDHQLPLPAGLPPERPALALVPDVAPDGTPAGELTGDEGVGPVAPPHAWSAAARELFAERAGILEHDAGLALRAAEQQATRDVVEAQAQTDPLLAAAMAAFDLAFVGFEDMEPKRPQAPARWSPFAR